MNSIAQKCRPKHQVLILKCYPATTKGAVDVKPNSSELSYLLYYATTRKSKVQKVGAFLEKKTASDVWRARIGNVQVTLQIIKALIEKAPRDLSLYAPYVLKILILILRSQDITMVEASIPTFEAFCENHDTASLSADQDYLQQYGEVIKMYASFASTRPQPAKVQPTAPVAMRWRKAGLHAILSISSSEALASVAGRQLDIIMPVLLENLWTENEGYLVILQERAQMEGSGDNDRLLKRRISSTTVRTVDTTDASAAALSGSTADADKLAEEDLGVLAMFCLKQLYEANNRQQIRSATIQTMKFVAERTIKGEKVIYRNPATGENRGWAPAIFEILSRWAPMQDRFVILVTAMETLVQSSLQEKDLKEQVVLASMISALLRSDINLIGLSVMDVLLGLIQHVLRILQLGGTPHPQHKESPGEAKEPPGSSHGNSMNELVAAPSGTRRQLLLQLQNCIGDLATHIYYADQVSVMIKAILVRLKPPSFSAIPTAAAAVEDPETTTNVILESGHLNQDPNTDGFFSFDRAKITALNSVKQILLVANHRSNVSGNSTLGRNQVSVNVWEGTQWLLRDSDPGVRKAYADALLTWLELETVKADLKAFDDEAAPSKTYRGREDSVFSRKQRAASTAASTISHRDKSGRFGPTAFLQLLHLAIYENALQFVISEPDIIMLHILLTALVNKLGVNAVQSGLPMIFRLQEDIQNVEEPVAKVRIGSLCHGYFWALVEKFDFENTQIGREIHNEIYRRKSKGIWVKIVKIPPPVLAQIGSFSTSKESPPLPDVEQEILRPFDGRTTMVNYIAEAYTESLVSPPASAPNSPGRAFSMPILGGSNVSQSKNVIPKLPTKMRLEMLNEWSRESAIAEAQRISTNQHNGSPSTRSESQQDFSRLAVNTNVPNLAVNGGTSSPNPHTGRSSSSKAYGLVGGLEAVQKLRNSSLQESSPTRGGGGSISSHTSTTRIDQLKKALTNYPIVVGGGGGLPVSRAGRRMIHSDASSESMVSYNFTASEMSFNPADMGPMRSRSRERGSNTFAGDASAEVDRSDAITLDQYLDEIEERGAGMGEEEDDVPPVPPLPGMFQGQNGSGEFHAPRTETGAVHGGGGGGSAWAARNGRRGRGVVGGGGGAASAASMRAASMSREREQRERESSLAVTTELENLLRGIETGASAGEKRGLVAKEQPPSYL